MEVEVVNPPASSIELEGSNKEETHISIKKPKRILHFSDGESFFCLHFGNFLEF